MTKAIYIFILDCIVIVRKKQEGRVIAKSRKISPKSAKQQTKSQPGKKRIILNLDSKHGNWIALAIFFVIVVIFFYEVIFDQKTFISPDAKAPTALSKPLSDALWTGQGYPQWMPYIFSGMPSFGSLMFTPFVYFPDVILFLIRKLLSLPALLSHIVHYPLAALGLFLFLRNKGVNFWGGLLGGITFMFTPFLITMEVFGHGSQMMTSAYIPITIWAADRLLEKRNVFYLVVAALIIGFQLQRGHVQIIYYTWFAIGLYAVFYIFNKWRSEHEKNDLIKSITFLAGALVLSCGLAASLYLSIYEYTPYSIRGGGAGGGVGFDYATQWSFHPKEMSTFLLPSFFGFGGQPYWGTLPFTDYPNYMGIISLILAVFAFVYNRRKIVWYFLTIIAISLLISFGKHFSPLYNLLYNYLPFFNKFRVPIMILILVQFSVAALAGIGFQNLVDLIKQGSLKEKAQEILKNKVLRISTISAVVIMGVVFLLSIFDDAFLKFMNSIYPVQYEINMQQQLNIIRFDMLIKNLWIMTILLVAGVALLWGRVKSKLNVNLFGLLFSLLILIDLWIVDYNLNKPVSAQSMEQYLAADETINFIKQDQEIFRIYPFPPLFDDNKWAAHEIASIGGYHPAKLKVYQNFIENTKLDATNRYRIPAFLVKYLNVVQKDGQPSLQAVPSEQIPTESLRADNAVMDMLNVKYLVSYYPIPDPRYKPVLQGRPFVFENTGVLPRAFFVDQIKVLEDSDDFFNYLKSGEFDPAKEAVLEEEPAFDIEPSTENRVEITSYNLQEINLKAQVTKPALMVLSEIYYPLGWKALINGQETKIYKTNNILRSILLEPGNHEIQFVFESRTFILGIWITFSTLLLLLALLVYGWRFKAKGYNLLSQSKTTNA